MRKAEQFFIGFSVIVAIMLYFTKPDSHSAIEDNDKQALALLFGGPQKNNSLQKQKTGNKNQSIYDSDFWKQGVKNVPIEDTTVPSDEEPEILEKVSEGNPINPQTGLPYTDEQMEAFDKLREKFPNNSLIPKRMTPDEKKAQEEKQRRMLEIQSKISVRKATPEEIEEYYEYQKKPIQDRLELLRYVLEKLTDELPEDLKSQYEEVLKMNERQLESLEEQKKALLRTATQGE
ncbi:MAG: hypothetical protein KatS3mg002_1461 [Candidatus Woesearchaeota archaeon]|nr:MAG: hypothetical protein KatS3mg002_1461 [Candidatus Woesearchaeota archaeon]